MRLIDADAVAEAINDEIEIAAEMETHEANVCKGGLMLALGYVNTAPAVDAVPRWIPCEERLPELDEICLVTEKDGSIRHCYFDSVDPVLFATVEEGMYVRNVIAWMPLPEPYEAERKDDDKSCDTCKHYDKWWDDIICDGCTKAYSNWERRDDES